MHQIFKANYIPVKVGKTVKWEARDCWAVQINGENLYGAYSKDDITKFLYARKPNKKTNQIRLEESYYTSE